MSLSLALYFWSLSLYNLASSQTVSSGSFTLIDEAMTWSDAKSRCNEFGLELASIHSYDDGLQVMNLCGLTSDTGCWVASNEMYLSRLDGRYIVNNVFGLTLPAICRAPHTAPPVIVTSQTVSLGSFTLIKEAMSWANATSRCIDLGLELASIHNYAEGYQATVYAL